MRVCFIENGELKDGTLEERKEIDFRPCFSVLSDEEWEQRREELDVSARISSEASAKRICRFESHDGFDYVTVSIPDREHPGEAHDNVTIYFRLNLLVFVYEGEECGDKLRNLLGEVREKGIKSLSLERILYEFFDQLTAGDSVFLEELEQRIFDMEEALLLNEEEDYARKILDLRRQLLVLKRYYEQLLDVSDAMEENENGLLSGKMAREFGILTSRIDRLLDGVVNLRDYVSQVRDAYQAQVDISQNQVMKLFTVITAIFLPLNLVAAWYGMNLRMPEFKLWFFYPVVIVVCIAAAVGSFLYFKRHKWV